MTEATPTERVAEAVQKIREVERVAEEQRQIRDAGLCLLRWQGRSVRGLALEFGISKSLVAQITDTRKGNG